MLLIPGGEEAAEVQLQKVHCLVGQLLCRAEEGDGAVPARPLQDGLQTVAHQQRFGAADLRLEKVEGVRIHVVGVMV